MKTKILTCFLFLVLLPFQIFCQVTGTVTVTSFPFPGVPVTLTPDDINGLGSGVTPFTRTYNIAENVTVNAPAEFNGLCFHKIVINGVYCQFTPPATFGVGGDVTIEVFYVPPFVLSVLGPSNALITVLPEDLNGESLGYPGFSRIYCPGTQVALTAPLIIGTTAGYCFKEWKENGAYYSNNAAISFTMNSNVTYEAVYDDCGYTLSIESECPLQGVVITTSLPDVINTSSVTTPDNLFYSNGYPYQYKVTTLTAPSLNSTSNPFKGWKKNGIFVTPTNPAVPNELTITVDANDNYTAVYDCNLVVMTRIDWVPYCPGTYWVTIKVNNFNQVASLSLALNYDEAQMEFLGIENLHPLLSDNFVYNAFMGSIYLGWYSLDPVSLEDGVMLDLVFDVSVGSCELSFDTANGISQYTDFNENLLPAMFTGVSAEVLNCYAIEHILTLASENPGEGVEIELSPPDNQGYSTGSTEFQRFYNWGSNVYIEAPKIAADHCFTYFKKNNIPYNNSHYLNVVVDGNTRWTAVFGQTARTLTVNSLPFNNVSIDLSPSDDYGTNLGSTPFNRHYCSSNPVEITLAAPGHYGYYEFKKWTKNGLDYQANPIITVLLDASAAYTAVYGLPLITTTMGDPQVVPCPGPVEVPIQVYGFNEVASISLSLEFDPSVLTFTGIKDLYPQVNPAGFIFNSFGSNVFLAWYSLTPVSIGDGILVVLKFNALPGTSPLIWDLGNDQCMYSDLYEVPIAAEFINGSVTFLGCNHVQGQLTYDNSMNSPMALDQVLLKQQALTIYETLTDNLGHYAFPILANGMYTFDGHTDKPWGSVNAADALQALRHFVGQITLTGLRLVAADVTGDGYVNATDCLDILKRFVGKITSFGAGDWAFGHPVITLDGTADVEQDFGAICVGDVDGTYVPGVKAQPSVALKMEGLIAVEGEVVDVPVKVLDPVETGAVTLVIEIPGECIQVSKVTVPGEGTLLFNQTGNELRIGWFSLEPLYLNAGDILLTLSCTIKPEFFNGSSCDWLPGEESSLADAGAKKLENVRLAYPKLIREGNSFYLGQNQPNPFTHQTEIPYYLPEAGKVNLKVHDMLGNQVITLVDQWQQAGKYNAFIDGSRLSAGVYNYQLEVAGESRYFHVAKRMIVEK